MIPDALPLFLSSEQSACYLILLIPRVKMVDTSNLPSYLAPVPATFKNCPEHLLICRKIEKLENPLSTPVPLILISLIKIALCYTGVRTQGLAPARWLYHLSHFTSPHICTLMNQ
jgi:hypothetical protein